MVPDASVEPLSFWVALPAMLVWIFAWRWLARRLAAVNWLVRHVAGFVLGSVCANLVVYASAAMSGNWIWWLAGAVVLIGVLAAMAPPPQEMEALPQPAAPPARPESPAIDRIADSGTPPRADPSPSPPPKTPPANEPVVARGPVLSAADIAEIEAIRQKSLAAMKKAATARAQDMQARGEVAATPLMYESPSAPAMKPASKARGKTPPPPRWEARSRGIGYNVPMPDTVANTEIGFETITFDYVDAQGERSHRTVDVTAVDDEYLEGFCHMAQAERTFVIGRIRGKVFVDDTAEVVAPKKWAAEARRNPLNGVVTMGGYTPKRYLPKEPVEDMDEILFTGFPAAKRAELEALAAGAGMRVVKTVTMDLMYLCIGPNAGPSKMAKADEVGAALIDEARFLNLI